MTPADFSASMRRVDSMPSSRQAALFLNRLGDADRRWLLDQLEPSQRTVLVDLLAELKALGIASIATPLARAASIPPEHVPKASAGSSAIELASACLTHARTRLVVELLRDEPAILVARTIRCAEPAWSRGFLARLEPVRRTEVASALKSMAGTTQGDALALAVLLTLRSRLDRASAPRGRFGRVASSVTSMLGHLKDRQQHRRRLDATRGPAAS